MALVTYGEGLGDFTDPSALLDFASLSLSAHTATFASVVDAFGFGLSLTGTGFTFDATSLTGGTATGFAVYGPGNIPLFSVVGFLHSAAPLADDLVHNRFSGRILDGNDTVIGSTNRDILFGLKGDDTVSGGQGGDILVASAGHDRLRGGAGADRFVFVANGGTDVVVDFVDNGSQGDDRIAVDRAIYDTMTIIDGGTRVTLDFGGLGKLALLGVTVGQIGIDDFSFKDPFAVLG